jgi:hypothetical protein
MVYRACLLVLLILLIAPAVQGETLYVAPAGDDANAGTSDAPLATPQAAVEKARTLRPDAGEVTIHLAAGTYRLDAPLTLDQRDSRTRFEGAQEGRAVLSGGQEITGWQTEGDLWVARVPEGSDFMNLWVNGERRTPARTPNEHAPWYETPPDEDFFRTAGPVRVTNGEGKRENSNLAFRFEEETFQDWDSLDDAVVVIYHSWATSLMRVKDLDLDKKEVTFTGPARWYYCRWQPDQRFYVAYLREGLDQPGEWYLDRDAAKLYYYPLPGETFENTTVVAPRLQQLVVIGGDRAEGTGASDITFSNLDLYHTDFPIAPEGHSDAQAAFAVNAAVSVTGGEKIALENCRIGHTGNYGVWFHRGTQNSRVSGCEIFDLGAGGVRIGEGNSPAREADAADHNVIENSYIHNGGNVFRSAVGVWIGRASYNTVRANEICDFRYTGISVGWSWGYAESSANHNIIDGNHVHHIGLGQLNDMGGIYMLGVSPGTQVTNNLFHDVMSHPRLYGGWGIYTDEGSSEILIKNNVVYNTRTGGFHQHYGRENHVENNVFAFSHTPQVVRSREEDHSSFNFERNIVYFNNGNLLGSTWRNGNWKMDHNCFWDTSGIPLNFAGRSLEEWRAEGFDRNSIVADPKFAAPLKGDFTLTDDSPVDAIGFEPIENRFPLFTDQDMWTVHPREIDRGPGYFPEGPEPFSLSDDFEDTVVGSTARDAATMEDGEGTIRVTDTQAASGKYSLLVQDASGLDKRYNPHLVYAPGIRYGTVTGTFKIRVTPGITFFHEWRDNSSPYRVGPMVWIDGEGKLGYNGGELFLLPMNMWVTLTITCDLGPEADGVWDLTVEYGGTERKYEALAVKDSAFNALYWWGFVSNADNNSRFYLDDIALEQAY